METKMARVGIAEADRDSVLEGVRRAVSLAGGLDEVVRTDSRVLVKPNYHRPAPSGIGLVTDAAVTEAVTRLVMELGPRSVIIGEGSGAGYDFPGHSTEESFQASGVSEVAQRLGVELRNLNNDDFEEVEPANALVMNRVKIARTALDSDVIISVPVLKSHIRTHVTLSLKNMKGVMPGNEKRKSHMLGLDMAIVDLNSVVKPNYAVVDAITGMEGLWQYPEDSKEMGLILAGRDALAVDMIGSSLMGIDPDQVMHLKHMAEREGVEGGVEGIEVVGEAVRKHRQRFKTGFEVFQSRYPRVRMVSGRGACSGCTGELVSAITYLKKAGYEREMEGLTVVIGDPDERNLGDKVAVLGKCARELSSLGPFVPGCPPSEEAMIGGLCEACGTDREHVLAVRDEARRKLWRASDEVMRR
jgi:uncharacterized protein (DUF362 family)